MGRIEKKELFKFLLSISIYILTRDVLKLVDSMVVFPLSEANIVVFIVSCIIVHVYYKENRSKTVQRVFFLMFMMGIWNLLSKILIFVPYNDKSSLGIFLGIAGVIVIGLPVAVFITDKIDNFLRENLV